MFADLNNKTHIYILNCVIITHWLQIRRPGFDSRHYQIFWGGGKKKKQVVGLERGPLSLVSTTEDLLDRKVAAPV
jgi:hypothetical protein